jgi:hypothetical protein
MAFRLPVIWEFGVEAQPAAGKSAVQWIASAEEEHTFLFQKTSQSFPCDTLTDSVIKVSSARRSLLSPRSSL